MAATLTDTSRKTVPTILCVSPHPDDEILGASGTLLTLRDEGWLVVNLAVSLGRPEDDARRGRELQLATERMGFINDVADPTLNISSSTDRDAAVKAVELLIQQRVTRYKPSVLLAPTPHDGHHGHEVVGVAAWNVARHTSCRLWTWALWGALPRPTILVPISRSRLDEATYALEAHKGELDRNDYRRLLRSRAEMVSVLGPELVFGFGVAGTGHEYCELLAEISFDEHGAVLGSPRILDAPHELAPFAGCARVDWIGTAPSPRQQITDAMTHFPAVD